jgi:hypothetical protein
MPGALLPARHARKSQNGDAIRRPSNDLQASGSDNQALLAQGGKMRGLVGFFDEAPQKNRQLFSIVLWN